MTDGETPVVLVTGAAGGIGAGPAVHRFATGGWRVVATDLTAPVRPEIEHAIDSDLTSVAECQRLVTEAVAATGRLDCLVDSAGV
jgi:NAD(P)-dependent dehydrogenase (short-subunit alcohol dehydrogenase family)